MARLLSLPKGKEPPKKEPPTALLSMHTHPSRGEDGGLSHYVKLSYRKKREPVALDVANLDEAKKIQRALWLILKEIGYIKGQTTNSTNISSTSFPWRQALREQGSFKLDRTPHKRHPNLFTVCLIRESVITEVHSVIDVLRFKRVTETSEKTETKKVFDIVVSQEGMLVFEAVRQIFRDHCYRVLGESSSEGGLAHAEFENNLSVVP